MKLSDAIILGDTLRKRDGKLFLTLDANGQHCGCALGGATLALGLKITYGNWYRDMLPQMLNIYPWLERSHVNNIGLKFMDAGEGTFGIDELIRFVRSIEPECGDCNRFNCSCSAQTLPEVQECSLSLTK